MNGVDSCYSWVVAVASGVIFLLVSCPVRLGAQIFVSLLDRYDTSRKEASLPFVLAQVFRSVSGPFAGALGEKIGLQEVTLLGCLLCSVGVGGCFIAEDVAVISVCLGVINGIGYGWSTALIPEILNRNFKKDRNKAFGVFFSGGGLGSLMIPPILDLILKQFGVSGTFLILAAIMLNSVPAAMLLIVPKCEKNQINLSPLLLLKRNNDATENRKMVNDCAMKVMAKYEVDQNEHLTENEKFPLNFENEIQISEESSKVQLMNNESPDHIENYNSDIEKFEEEKHMNVLLIAKTKQYSIHNLKLLNKQQLSNYTACEKNLNTKKEGFNPSEATLLSKFSILWSAEYIAIALLNGVCIFVNQVFWTIMVDFVRDKGVEQSLEAYFVISLSLFDTIGRLTLGSIPDKGLMTIANYTSCCFAVIGFIFVLLVWLPEFFSLLTIISFMGFIFGGITTVMPSVVTEFINEEKRPIAMASRLLFSAPMCLTISPLIGLFRGSLGSYSGLLYVMSSMCAVCVALVLILPILKKRRDRAQIKEIT